MLTEQFDLQNYLNEMQSIKERLDAGEACLDDLMQCIAQNQQHCAASGTALEPFFAGEHCFFQEDYENALKNYLKTKSLPSSQFFCFRASAFIAYQRGNHEQALKFARKANALQPEDPSICRLLTTLESQEQQPMAHKMPEGSHLSEAAKQCQLDLMNSSERALEMRIQQFQQRRARQLSHYVQQAHLRNKVDDYCLYAFNGWEQQPKQLQGMEEKEESWGYFFLNNKLRNPSCGLYMRWNGKGIAINPGHRFLDCFHRAGLHIADIDIVLVTHTEAESYADVPQIYELNYHLNKISSELKVIHYYLSHTAHLDLSPLLKPNFKQERNALHSLELFVDSPEVERIELTPDIILNYFPTSTREALAHHQMSNNLSKRGNQSPLGIRLDLHHTCGGERRSVRMGYLSGTPWSPLLGHHLGSCDMLFTGFGNTNLNDFGKLNYNDSCLGYFGSYSLAEEVKPRLLFCCEFDGREGDIRLEVSRKLRQEVSAPVTILPADNGLFVDLRECKVRCSVSDELVSPDQIRIVKSGDAFSPLLYVAPNQLLEP